MRCHTLQWDVGPAEKANVKGGSALVQEGAHGLKDGSGVMGGCGALGVWWAVGENEQSGGARPSNTNKKETCQEPARDTKATDKE